MNTPDHLDGFEDEKKNAPDRMDDLNEKLHEEACSQKKAWYIDPNTGKFIFTKYYLLQRGSCCALGCRHCPYFDRC